MRGLFKHVTVYHAVCVVAVFAWLMSTGSVSELNGYTRDPATALTPDFWPIALIVVWGMVVVIHAAAVLSRQASPRHRARARQRRERRLDRLHDPLHDHAADHDTTPTGPIRRQMSVMFTDIAGSTPLAETLGDDRWAAVLVEHRTLVRATLAGHGGTEVGTQGDGFLVRFEDPDQAVTCAVDLQRCLDARRSDDATVPRLRVGIHAGEAVTDDDDLIGRVVNLASRVVDQAGPDEVLVTEPVAEHLRTPVVLHDRGLQQLKGITGPRHLLAVVWSDDPPDDTVTVLT
jgi:class 3 adenylate cyclase